MSKPEDIPQNVLEAAATINDEISDWVEAFDGWNRPKTVEVIARAILAAKAEERQGAIGEIDTLIESLNEGLMTDSDLTNTDRVAMGHQIEALNVAADILRKRGEA